MAGQFFLWSKTAATNANADNTIGMAEGMAPSAVNDGIRALMASTKSWVDDISGTITTGGTSTALTVASNQVFDSLAHMNGAMVAFVPHTTTGATVTLNCDGLGAKPLRGAPSVELPAGVLVQGTPYVATYNSSDAVWYLQNYFVNPYQVPIGGCLDYFGATAPNAAFVLPIGQAISRTTYSACFSLFGTTYGGGDGSTTFNVPDLSGRVTAMKEASATRLTSTYFGGTSTSLGAVGGSESNLLAATNLPPITSTNASQAISVTSSANVTQNADYISYVNAGGGGTIVLNSSPTNSHLTSTGTNSISVTSTGTNSNPHANVQPTIICNKILRVL